jgi:hypothetical protein
MVVAALGMERGGIGVGVVVRLIEGCCLCFLLMCDERRPGDWFAFVVTLGYPLVRGEAPGDPEVTRRHSSTS